MSVYTDLNQILSNSSNSFDDFSILVDGARYKVSDFKNGTYSFLTYFDWYAKPKTNLDKVKVDTNIINDVNNKFRERKTITESIIDDLSDIINLKVTDFDDKFHSDLCVRELESEIDVTFITEGAGYKNVLGYYFYRVADGSIMTVNGQSYQTYDGQPLILSGTIDGNDYTPTFIYPNCSKKNSGGKLLQGHKRKLHGNRANGKFQNVNVGFFVVPNGWKNTTDLVLYNNKPIIHSTPRMNHNWNESAESLTNAFIENNGYQSLFIQYPTNDGNKNVLAFEDISRPGGDKDFNDAIFLVEIDNEYDNCDKYTDVTDEATSTGTTYNKVNIPINKISVSESKMMTYGISGIFATILKDDVPNFDEQAGSNYCLVHKIFCVNATFAQEVETLLNSINFDASVVMTATRSTNLVTVEYLIPHDVLDTNTVTLVDDSNNSFQEFQVNLMDPFDNYVEEEPTDELLDLQHRLFSSDIVIANEYDFVHKDIIDTEIISRTVDPSRLESTVLIWGDPHITTIHGIRYTMEHVIGSFPVFVNDEYTIVGEFWKPIPGFDFTFFKSLSIKMNKCNEKYIVDFENFKAYDASNGIDTMIELDLNEPNCTPNGINISMQGVPRITDYEHPEIVDESNPVNAIVVKYGDLDIVCMDYRFDQYVMNIINFDYDVLSQSNYKSRAHGVLVKRRPENYTHMDL
jgi:hypothetical protein